jgi:drug/metabolite transporter (DMT)-like permease
MSLSSGIGCLLVIPFLPLPDRASWPHIILSALIHVIYSLLLVRMYRQGDFGVTYPVARGSSPLLIALGGMVLGAEFVSTVSAIGIVLVSAGIFTLARGGEQLHGKNVSAALATGISIAAYSLTDGLGARVAGNAASYAAWMMLLYGLSMPWVFMALRRGSGAGLFAHRSRKDLAQAVGGGLVSVLGYGIVIWAMKYSPMGMVSALRETSVLFAAILGRIFLGEAFTVKKVAAAILIGAGAICLRH